MVLRFRLVSYLTDGLAVVVINHVIIIFLLADTAFIASRGGWLYCDDSRVTLANAKEVVVSFSLLSFSVEPFFFSLADCWHMKSQGKPAYVLYYKRVKP